ncbi:MAG: hypothetical protein MOGMAGMI_02492 [Candidatus Omnitrophica bacterium]|nr:hypothetical protein [Candidatus Omnitrophota bacterium]
MQHVDAAVRAGGRYWQGRTGVVRVYLPGAAIKALAPEDRISKTDLARWNAYYDPQTNSVIGVPPHIAASMMASLAGAATQTDEPQQAAAAQPSVCPVCGTAGRHGEVCECSGERFGYPLVGHQTINGSQEVY